MINRIYSKSDSKSFGKLGYKRYCGFHLDSSVSLGSFALWRASCHVMSSPAKRCMRWGARPPTTSHQGLLTTAAEWTWRHTGSTCPSVSAAKGLKLPDGSGLQPLTQPIQEKPRWATSSFRTRNWARQWLSATQAAKFTLQVDLKDKHKQIKLKRHNWRNKNKS